MKWLLIKSYYFVLLISIPQTIIKNVTKIQYKSMAWRFMEADFFLLLIALSLYGKPITNKKVYQGCTLLLNTCIAL